MTSSSSSPVLTSIFSGRGIIGSKCGPSWSSSVVDSSRSAECGVVNSLVPNPGNPDGELPEVGFFPNGLLPRDELAIDWNDNDDTLGEPNRNFCSLFGKVSFVSCMAGAESLSL